MLETFKPNYTEHSTHALVPVQGTVGFLTTLKEMLEAAGWRVTQTFKGRGALVVGFLPTATPLQPGEVVTPSIVHFKRPSGSGVVGNSYYQYFDPLRQTPGGDAGVAWVKMGIGNDFLGTAGELGAAIAPGLGARFVGLDTAGLPYGQAYLLFDGAPLGSASIEVFGDGTVSGTNNYVDPYFNVVNTTLSNFAAQGAGWELISPDGSMLVALDERLDTLNYKAPGNTLRTAPYLRIKPSGADNYQFLYPFAINSSVMPYHFHVSEKQVVVWLDGVAGTAGRPTNIIVSSLSIPDEPPAFLGANLASVLVVICSMISVDGSYFSGDNAGNPAQVRDHLWYCRGVAQDFYSYNEGDTYSQSRGGPGSVFFESGFPGFIMRGLDNGRNLLATNGEPLAQTPWLVVSKRLRDDPSWIAGKLNDAMLLSYAPQPGAETVIKHGGKRWHLLSSQATGGADLNGSLWLTAVHDSTVPGSL